jgi:K+-sensing histidine kinase KdpD
VLSQLHIIATSEEGTRAALREARRLARRLHVARTVLLVPCTPSQGIAATDEHIRTVDNYRQMASETGVDVTVRMCFGSSWRGLCQWMLPPGSTTVVGGKRRWWWPTRAQRLVHTLKRAGHQIVFADTSGPDHAGV